MLEEHGDDYRNYMHRTGMFLPFEPGRKIYALLFGWIKSPGWALASSYAVILTICVALAFGLRSYTISQTSMVYLPGKQLTAISTMPKSEPSMKLILDNAYQQRVVTEALTDFRQEGHKGFLVHMMPRNYMMQGLFAQPSDADMGSMRRFSWRAILGFVFPFIHSHNHHTMAGESEDGKVRLIFSQLTWPNGEYAPADKALNFTVKHLPLLKVDIDLKNYEVQAVERTPIRNFWGQMPMPLL